MRTTRKSRKERAGMKYRQWKKNYKKRYGVNPPIELDKRKQRRAARRALKKMTAAGSFCSLADVAERVADTFTNLTATLLRNIGGAFDTAGTVCRNAADGIQPLEVKGRVFSWEVRTYDSSHYAVYEINALGGADELRAVTHSERAAEKVAEILESDHLEYIKQTSPDRIRKKRIAAGVQRAIAEAVAGNV